MEDVRRGRTRTGAGTSASTRTGTSTRELALRTALILVRAESAWVDEFITRSRAYAARKARGRVGSVNRRGCLWMHKLLLVMLLVLLLVLLLKELLLVVILILLLNSRRARRVRNERHLPAIPIVVVVVRICNDCTCSVWSHNRSTDDRPTPTGPRRRCVLSRLGLRCRESLAKTQRILHLLPLRTLSSEPRDVAIPVPAPVAFVQPSLLESARPLAPRIDEVLVLDRHAGRIGWGESGELSGEGALAGVRPGCSEELE